VSIGNCDEGLVANGDVLGQREWQRKLSRQGAQEDVPVASSRLHSLIRRTRRHGGMSYGHEQRTGRAGDW
jgi:hypothetical protein